MYGLQPQIQPDIRAFLHANKCYTKITWCRHMLFQRPHGSWTASKILDVESQGRTSISFNENSC
ncbi:hypothetical protein AHiyo6_17000 [Arthrobacter sp. Hiyo6]|nr:hypothetical protein AHiyo6_17000 [Arthrobacter sp. Hiyo6]